MSFKIFGLAHFVNENNKITNIVKLLYKLLLVILSTKLLKLNFSSKKFINTNFQKLVLMQMFSTKICEIILLANNGKKGKLA